MLGGHLTQNRTVDVLRNNLQGYFQQHAIALGTCAGSHPRFRSFRCSNITTRKWCLFHSNAGKHSRSRKHSKSGVTCFCTLCLSWDMAEALTRVGYPARVRIDSFLSCLWPSREGGEGFRKRRASALLVLRKRHANG